MHFNKLLKGKSLNPSRSCAHWSLIRLHGFIPPLVVLGTTWFKCSYLRTVPLFGLAQANHGFDSPCGSHQLPIFLKYSVSLKLLAQLVQIGENIRHSAAWHKLLKVCSDGRKCLVFLGYNSRWKIMPILQINAKLQSLRLRHHYGVFGSTSQTSFPRNATGPGAKKDGCFRRLSNHELRENSLFRGQFGLPSSAKYKNSTKKLKSIRTAIYIFRNSSPWPVF